MRKAENGGAATTVTTYQDDPLYLQIGCAAAVILANGRSLPRSTSSSARTRSGSQTGHPKLEKAYRRCFLWPDKGLFHQIVARETRE
jgi:hypothetical protein